MAANTDDRIPTNLRTLLLLEALGKEPDARTPASLGREIGLPKQTVHRLCSTLNDQGFLARDEIDGGFRPGRRARELAAGILFTSTSYIARHQVLLDLAERVGETVNFAVPEDQGMSYKDRVETNWAFRIQLPVGTHVPFHCTASGKTFLASLPKAERRRLVSVMTLDPRTENTITDPAVLLDELQKIARQGFAIDNEEFIDDMVATAVPVRAPTGRYIASLAFHGPTQRMSAAKAVDLAKEVQAAATKLEHVLFD